MGALAAEDHFHLIITPADIPLERAVQFVKGGFSFRAGRELASVSEIWQKGFTDHRIRDASNHRRCREYIILNPVRAIVHGTRAISLQFCIVQVHFGRRPAAAESRLKLVFLWLG
jgi:hypothetical protein